MRRIIAAFAVAATMLAGCDGGGAGESVEVRFTRVVPADFSEGRAGSCQIVGNIVNTTKYHLEGLTFDVDKTRITVDGGLEANAHADDVVFATINPGGSNGAPFADCAAVARLIADKGTSASVLGCTMTNVAEGDCQNMVTFASNVDDAAVAAVAAQEAQAMAAEADQLKAQAAPLRAAVAGLSDDTALLNAVVYADSQFWAINRYDNFSMHNVVQESSGDGARVLHGDYTFNGGQAGWVRVTLYKDMARVPCVEFWDFAGSCRDARVPDNFTAPTAPPAAAPDAAVPDAPAPDASTAASDTTGTTDQTSTGNGSDTGQDGAH